MLIRHAITTPGVGDPPGMRLDDCSTQRNLTDDGRRHARQVGAAFRARGIVVERVLTSPWCRCVETARLAFGAAEVSAPLGNLYGRPENRDRQVDALQKLVGQPPGRGNVVLVSHAHDRARSPVSTRTRPMVVITPRPPGGFAMSGRLTAHTP